MESTETFSLLSEPWIPVSDADGGISEVSLRSVLADADRVVSIKGESSTQTFALIRLRSTGRRIPMPGLTCMKPVGFRRRR